MKEIKQLCHRDRTIVPNSLVLPVLCSLLASKQAGRQAGRQLSKSTSTQTLLPMLWAASPFSRGLSMTLCGFTS